MARIQHTSGVRVVADSEARREPRTLEEIKKLVQDELAINPGRTKSWFQKAHGLNNSRLKELEAVGIKFKAYDRSKGGGWR